MFIKVKSVMAKLQKGAAFIWYEKEESCLLCGGISSARVCRDCIRDYFQPEVRRCLSCGKLLREEKDQCRDCAVGEGPAGLHKVLSLGCYEGLWKQLIQNVKYKGQPDLLVPLADYLIPLAIKNLPPPDGIVPVPMHPAKINERGFNQAEVLASILSRKLGIRLINSLVRIRETVPQSTLGRQERINNMNGAFTANPEIVVRQEIIWLVDDVVTTGATLGACAKILSACGVREIYALCLGAGKEK